MDSSVPILTKRPIKIKHKQTGKYMYIKTSWGNDYISLSEKYSIFYINIYNTKDGALIPYNKKITIESRGTGQRMYERLLTGYISFENRIYYPGSESNCILIKSSSNNENHVCDSDEVLIRNDLWHDKSMKISDGWLTCEENGDVWILENVN